ncbi:MAG: DUF1553 domain-containing protein [Planctomycetes bacterium]|nr:DUF1553 domain-containing protein [Planctomycetota bacterium]
MTHLPDMPERSGPCLPTCRLEISRGMIAMPNLARTCATLPWSRLWVWAACLSLWPLTGFADEPKTTADYDAVVSDLEREHWSFRPIRRPAIPAVRNRDWVRNPIDQFILAGLEAKGWQPNPQARPQALVRRLSFDLTGLPPTPEDLADIANAADPTAFDRLVDALLARPSYGERWGRHWLDLVRYAESNGYERDGAKPSVWRYRDYVIQSFNTDKPYDRFILEQLAGDELPDANSETVIALGYYRLGPWDDEPADPAEDRFDQLDDMVSTTSQVFLGLTLGCARCHNHKFEPLTTLDYYRMTAIFNPLQRFQNGRSDLDAPAGSAAELAALAARDRRIAELTGQMTGLRLEFQQAWLNGTESRLSPEARAAFLAAPASRTADQKRLVEQFTKMLDDEINTALPAASQARLSQWADEIATLKRQTPDLPRAYYLHEPQPQPPETHVLLRGKPGRPGIVAPPGIPAVLTGEQPQFLTPDARTSRRRLTLARWLTDPRNPLTPRVIVNRVWQFHFGEGLVRTSSDFGIMGDPPSHPDLLDYLAGEFVRQGWSLKWLHRQILSSATYRMSKDSRDDYAAVDPENRLWWRFPYRRLEVEAIRDSMLVASGRLNRNMFGPPMHPFIPQEALAGSSDPGSIWPAYDEVSASRRTVYAYVKRSLVVPMLEVLDLCDTTKSSARRQITSVAPQALTLFNGRFVNEQAEHLARRVEREAGTDPAGQVARAWQLALARSPSNTEQQTMQAYLQSEAAKRLAEATAAVKPLPEAEARHQALVQLCRVIFNLNEFAYPD